MIKNTFKLVFVYAIILGIAGALASGFISTGIIVFTLIDQLFVHFDSSSAAFTSQSNYVDITIVKIVAALAALLPLTLLIKLTTGALILKPTSLLAFTARTGVNTVNRTTRGLTNAARNGLRNSVDAVKGIANGDPMSMYRSARYAEMAMGRSNKFTRLLRRGGDIADFSQNLAGNTGETRDKKDAKDNKDSKFMKPKKTSDIAKEFDNNNKRQRALNNIRRHQRREVWQARWGKFFADTPEAKAEAQKRLEDADTVLWSARAASAKNRLGLGADKFDDFIERYDSAHPELTVAKMSGNAIPEHARNAANWITSNATQILNSSSSPDVTTTNAEGERGEFFSTHSSAAEVDEEVANAELDKIEKATGNPIKHMAGLPDGQTDEEERLEISDRIAVEGRGILSRIKSAAQIMGSNSAIYGTHLNGNRYFDSNASRQDIEQGHVDSAEKYAEGMDSGVAKEHLEEDVQRIRREARDRNGLFTLSHEEFQQAAAANGIDEISFKDQDADFIGDVGKAYVYENEDGERMVRLSQVEVKENVDDPNSATTLKDVDIMLDKESQQMIQERGLTNEEIVQGLAEGKLNAQVVNSSTGENGETTSRVESISFVEQIRKEVETQKEYTTQTTENRQITQDSAQASSAQGSNQQVETQSSNQQAASQGPLQPGQARVIQGAPVSNEVVTNSVQGINETVGSNVATISDNGEIKISLDSAQIERLIARRSEGESSRGSSRESNANEGSTNFINSIIDALSPSSASSVGSTVTNNNSTTTNNNTNNSTNNSSTYRSGDNVNVFIDPSTGKQRYERSNRDTSSAPEVSSAGIEEELYNAQMNRNSERLQEQIENASDQIGGEERGNRLGGARE